MRPYQLGVGRVGRKGGLLDHENKYIFDVFWGLVLTTFKHWSEWGSKGRKEWLSSVRYDTPRSRKADKVGG